MTACDYENHHCNYLVPLFQNESLCETLHMQMSLFSIKMNLA